MIQTNDCDKEEGGCVPSARAIELHKRLPARRKYNLFFLQNINKVFE